MHRPKDDLVPLHLFGDVLLDQTGNIGVAARPTIRKRKQSKLRFRKSGRRNFPRREGMPPQIGKDKEAKVDLPTCLAPVIRVTGRLLTEFSISVNIVRFIICP